MNTFNEGIPWELCGLEPTTWDTYGGIPRGQYTYVKYDRRNGPLKVGECVSLRDEKTFEVVPCDMGKSLSFYGVTLVATKKWALWNQFLWLITGKRQGKYSPIRYFFVLTKGAING